MKVEVTSFSWNWGKPVDTNQDNQLGGGGVGWCNRNRDIYNTKRLC